MSVWVFVLVIICLFFLGFIMGRRLNVVHVDHCLECGKFIKKVQKRKF